MPADPIPSNPDTDPPAPTPEEMAAADTVEREESGVRMRCLELAHQRVSIGGLHAEDSMYTMAQDMFMFARYSLLPADTRTLTQDERDATAN